MSARRSSGRASARPIIWLIVVRRLLLSAVLAASTSCVVIYDLADLEGTGGQQQGGGSPSSTQTGTSSTGSAGGGGGGGGGCVLPGDGPAAPGTPWVVGLGPIDAPLDWTISPGADFELVGDKIFFGTVLFDNPEPVTFNGTPLAGAGEDAFVFGWVDDGGQSADAWLLTTLVPAQTAVDQNQIPVSEASINVAPWHARNLLVALGDRDPAANIISVIQLDPCSREETEILRCNNSAYAGIDADPDADRIAISFEAFSQPGCSFTGPFADCEGKVPTIGARSTMAFSLEPNGDGSYTCRGSATGGPVTLAPDGRIWAAGIYQSSRFDPPLQIVTGESPDVFHAYVAQLAPTSEAALSPAATVDLGRSGLFEVPHAITSALVDGSEVVVVASISTAPLPDGSILPAGANFNGIDVMIARVPLPSGAPDTAWPSGSAWGKVYGGTGNDRATRLTRTPDGVVLAGATYGPSPFGPCGDGVAEGGCAFFTEVSLSDGSLTGSLLVDATSVASLTGELGFAGWLLPGSDYVIAGATDGALSLPGGTYPAPPGGNLRNIYIARQPQP